jgi:hypothetical protein
MGGSRQGQTSKDCAIRFVQIYAPSNSNPGACLPKSPLTAWCSFPVDIHPDYSKKTQIAIRQTVTGRSPRHDGRRASCFERVHVFACFYVRDLQSVAYVSTCQPRSQSTNVNTIPCRTFIATADNVTAIKGET